MLSCIRIGFDFKPVHVPAMFYDKVDLSVTGRKFRMYEGVITLEKLTQIHIEIKMIDRLIDA